MLLIGHRIAYSASPAMQNAAFAAAGLADWTYEVRDVDAAGLEGVVEEMRGAAVAGANVTIPHKVAVARAVDDLDPQARATGAVNTVVNSNGRLLGSNTDVAGIAAALDEVGVAPGPGVRALVLGGGGSARAALAALAGAEVVCAVRRPEAVTFDAEFVGWDRRGEEGRGADLVVNCTPLGRTGELPLEAADLPRRAVVDLVYRSEGTPLVAAARAAGLKAADGWTVLLAQGAASFEAWTGRPAPLPAMREALA